MSITKRCISLLLVLCLVLSAAPVTVHAVSSGTCGENVTWTLSDDGVLTISGTGPMTDYTSYDAMPWNGNKSSIYSVIIENGVTTIGDHAFHYCRRLSSAEIPDSVTTIGNAAFYSCNSLSSVEIGNSVTTIGDRAFRECHSLSSVVIPDSVTSIGDSAFFSCDSLSSIYVDADNPSYSSDDRGVLFDKQKTYLIQAPMAISGFYTIPDSVITIGEYAFCDCRLNSIVIPDSVTTIGYSAFFRSSLNSVVIGNGVISIGEDAFRVCDSLSSVEIPDSVTTIGEDAFLGCNSLSSVEIPDSVTTIGYGAFRGCNSLSRISVDRNNIYYSSDECGVLFDKQKRTLVQAPGTISGSYIIPGNVITIDRYAFYSCNSLSGVEIPDSVTTIGYEAFYCCNSLGSVEIPDSVTTIGNYAFRWCSSLTSVKFRGDAPTIASDAFYQVTATAYYPANNPTWTADVMQDYGGDITWVPYTPDNVDPPAPSVGTHDTLKQLTDMDYLLFSEIAYSDSLSGKIGKNISEILSGKWNKEWKEKGVTYADAYGPISNWVLRKTWSYSDGFSAALFMNESNEAVLSFCGSRPINLDNIASKTWDLIMDWVVNDFAVEVFDMYGPQVNNAIYTYIEALMENPTDIKFTGHSLGGALADIASAYSGYEAISFNAISALDVAYTDYPREMSRAFTGVDEWNITDHTNEHDILAGMYEEMVDSTRPPIKPYQSHKNTGSATDLIANHGLTSIVEVGADGCVDLTPEINAFHPTKSITTDLPGSLSVLHLGTTGDDTFSMGLNFMIPKVSYGGNGDDHIVTGILSDTLIGGKDNDVLNGDYGDDDYLYYKGDGLDYIYDIGGDDTLYLYGFSDSDIIGATDNLGSHFIDISCNGKVIISISKNNREYSGWLSGDSFKVKVTINGHERTINITDLFNTHKAGYRLIVGCPVNVEVLDPDGNVAFTLTDGEVGTWYTEYGNFYVFEEENGEYGKVLDLVEGYTARIVGADEGTMDVTYQVPVDGELSEPVSVSGVPVTEELIATFEASEDGDVYLVIDEDGDGEADSERKLYGECPFTDVPEGSFYYEPVMWAVDRGITNGTDETHFEPESKCTRGQVVTFLWRAAGYPEPKNADNPFTDVKEGKFYYKAVLWAVENGITKGMTDTTFVPDTKCNRGQVVTFLWRAAGSPEPESTNNPFVDVKTTDFFYKSVLWAVENGITNGVDAAHFGPATDCNRAQVVTFLYRAYN